MKREFVRTENAKRFRAAIAMLEALSLIHI